jgi:hypothetical protein
MKRLWLLALIVIFLISQAWTDETKSLTSHGATVGIRCDLLIRPVLAAIPAARFVAGTAMAVGTPAAALDAEMQEGATATFHQAATLETWLFEFRLSCDRGPLGPANRRDDRRYRHRITRGRGLIMSQSVKSVRAPRQLREQFAPLTHEVAPSQQDQPSHLLNILCRPTASSKASNQ